MMSVCLSTQRRGHVTAISHLIGRTHARDVISAVHAHTRTMCNEMLKGVYCEHVVVTFFSGILIVLKLSHVKEQLTS